MRGAWSSRISRWGSSWWSTPRISVFCDGGSGWQGEGQEVFFFATKAIFFFLCDGKGSNAASSVWAGEWQDGILQAPRQCVFAFLGSWGALGWDANGSLVCSGLSQRDTAWFRG